MKNMTTDEKIIALVKPEYLNKIPAMSRKHATENTVKMIAKEHEDLYNAFAKDAEPTAEEKKQMSDLVNGIFEARMKKHHML